MSQERKGILRETVEILIKSTLVVGLIGIIGNLVNWEKVANLKKVIFSRK